MRLLPLRQAVAGALAAVLLAGCGASVASDTGSTDASPSSASSRAVTTTAGTTVEDVLDDAVAVETGDTSYDEADATTITLSGSGAESDSDGVGVDDGTVTISEAGTYVLTGELTGQVVVDSPGDGVVRLVLDDATITNS